MKTNKFFAIALAAITMVSLNACKDHSGTEDPETGGNTGGGDTKTEYSIDQVKTAYSVVEGETVQLEFVVTPETTDLEFVSSDPTIATVDAAGLVTGVAEGTTRVTLTVGEQSARWAITVTKKADDNQGGSAGEYSAVYPIIMDATTSEKLESVIKIDMRPDDVNKFLYVWDGTYTGAESSGQNFYKTGVGDYTSLQVGGAGWAGCGYFLNSEYHQQLKDLATVIAANPNDYFLHIAIKSADQASHCFYFFGLESTKFVLGSSVVYDGPIYADFTRDGSWAEFDIPMANYASALAGFTPTGDGTNVFVALSEGVQGALLNLDAVFFYKK